MRNLMLFAAMLAVLGLTSCSFLKEKALPQAKEAAAAKLTEAIVKTGQCAKADEVRADVDKLLKLEGNQGLVVKAVGSESAPAGAQEEGVVSEICKAAAKLALPALLEKGVPADWECSLTDLNSKVGELAQKACGQVPL